MQITYVHIKIIDTYQNNRVLIEEFAQRNQINFIYNGSNDRFGQLMASELHFNMLVKDAADAKFLHLFTGSETRFKVVLEDASDLENTTTLWTGHLLPEQFSEPYTGGSFFVAFIATDGLGRIKNKKLDASFYNVKKPVSEVFAECLLQTGLTLPLFIAPAIVNAVQDVKLHQIAVNTAAYVDNNKNLDPYTILEKLLISMGCKLFQWNNNWYVIGINRLTDTSIEFQEFNSVGAYVDQTIVARGIQDIKFNETPIVSIQPSFKNVTIDWDKNQSDEILPEDINYQPFTVPLIWDEEIEVAHWAKNTENFVLGLASYTQLVNFVFTPGGYLYKPTFDPLPTEDPFYVSLYPATSDNLTTNYISLAAPKYIKGREGDLKKCTLSIDFKFMSYVTIKTAFDNGDFDNSFKYELLLDGVVIVSNKTSFTNYEGFDFKLNLDSDEVNIIGSLEIKTIPINTNGELDLRLFAPVGVAAASRVVYKTISITYNSEDETLEKIRDIDFTTIQTVAIFHGDDEMDITNRQWLFTDDLVVSTDLNTTAFSQQLPIISTETKVYPLVNYSVVYWFISEESYNLMLQYPGAIYKKTTAGAYEIGTFASLASQHEDGRYAIWEIVLTGNSPTYLVPGYEFWIMVAASTETITNHRYLRERWKRYEQTEEIRYIDALARVYHDTVNTAAFKINGSTNSILNPLELINFKFIDTKQFVITNVSVAVDDTLSTVDLVESKKSNVTDYE